MEEIGGILLWVLFGLVVGVIARFLVPGPQPMGIVMTILLGIVGSFAGGFLAYLIWGGDAIQSSGLLFSILGAIAVVAIYGAVMGGGRRRRLDT
jgi:uncharacterized membrane protein YeaQ/YmgE (transglycosylase-associated protein family)